MTRFWMTWLLPASAVGAAAVLTLYATQHILYRINKIQWNIRIVMAALSLFLLPFSWLRLPAPPPQDILPGQPAGETHAVLTQRTAISSGESNLLPEGDSTASAAAQPSHTADTATVWSGALLRILPWAWLAGAVLTAAGTGVAYLRFCRRLKRESRRILDAERQGRLALAMQEAGLRHSVALREAQAIRSPVAVGLLRPCIYLPAGMKGTRALDYALRHECTHLRRGHLACKLLAQAVCALHWFNPAAWLLRHMLHDACEFDCDRAVAHRLEQKEKWNYCEALLYAAEGCRPPMPASAFARPVRTLKKRMEVILMPKQNKVKRGISLVLCAAVLAGVVGLTACAAGEAAQEADTKWADETASQSVPAPNAPSAPSKKTLADEANSESFAPEELPAENAGADRGEASPEEYIWPVPNYRYLSTIFAPLDDNGIAIGHSGIDIIAEQGADIVAIRGGVVSSTAAPFSYGKNVRIDHGDGLTSFYAHCEDIVVQNGETIQAGQVIAHVGATGATTGYHCHLEMEQDGTLVDPMTYLDEPGIAAVDAGELDYVWPVTGYNTLSRAYGVLDSQNAVHNGVDIPAPEGTDIVAAMDGTVEEAAFDYTMGNTIQLSHGNGIFSCYAHCSDLLVKEGDAVKAGQVIAHVGSTGNSTGNHCHWEIQQNHCYLDPSSLRYTNRNQPQEIPAAPATPPESVAPAAPVTFMPGMGCNDPACTDPAHHHDCPAACTDYSHHHTCPLNCTDAAHHHGGFTTASGGGHHGGGHHHR